MGPPITQKRIMIIAGEVSGDLHGAKLVRAMRKKNNSLFFCGIGGQSLKDAGVRILVDASKLSVVGITEALFKMPNLLKGMAIAKKNLKTLHPDLLILIDFPDFNLNVAATAKKLGIPVLYYISPQIWAWRLGRVKKIGELVNHVAVILPFEEDFYKKHDIPATFVGHPLLDNNLSQQVTALEKPVKDATVVGLLPGSRDREIDRLLPLMLDAARILARQISNIKFIISQAPAVKGNYMERIIRKHGGSVGFDIMTGDVGKILERCKLVIAASGTVTLEAAIYGTPMVIIYKVSPASYWLGRAMVRVKHIGLVNLIAGKEIVPELLQDKASPSIIADKVYEMLSDAPGLERLRKDLLGINDVLGGPGASERVADLAVSML